MSKAAVSELTEKALNICLSYLDSQETKLNSLLSYLSTQKSNCDLYQWSLWEDLMPRAVAVTDDLEVINLKTCPEGYVKLRRLTFGQKLVRQQMTMKMLMSGDSKSKEMSGEMAFVSAQATEYEFAHCIVEHNLEDADGKTLDFKQAKDVRALDPRIGEEIQTELDRLNNFEVADQDNIEGNS